MEKASSAKQSSSGKVKLDSSLLFSSCLAANLYLSAIQTLSQLKLDILAGLCFQDVLLPRLWKLVTDVGPQCGLKTYTDILSSRPNDTTHPIFGLLQLSCDTAAHVIVILDDVEMYEQGKPFTIDNLVAVSNFCNHFVFRVIWNKFIDLKSAPTCHVFNSVHSLLMVLYERDCRRKYSPPDHWLIRDIKASAFIAELEKNSKTAHYLLQKTPHIIPHKE